MRKSIIFILLWVFIFTVSSQEFKVHKIKKHTTNTTTVQQDTINSRTTLNQRISTANSTASDSLWYITATGRDSSRVYRTNSYQSIKYACVDTNGTDSVSIKIKYYQAETHLANIPAFSAFALVDSVTVSDENIGYWNLNQETTRDALRFYYLTIEGTSVNKILFAVQTQLAHVGWEESRQ